MTELLFTKEEWDAAAPTVVTKMTNFLSPYRTAIYEHIPANGNQDEYGQGWGSGSYIRIGNRVFILTNEHVADARCNQRVLAHQFNGQEDIRRIVGNHTSYGYPVDLALLPVDMAAWNDQTNGSKAIGIEQIALAHCPAQTELLAFTGFSGQNVSFHFGALIAKATCYTAREADLPSDTNFSSRFHFGIDYKPDLATDVIDKEGLPLPPGLSGSTVWDTGFVAAKMRGVTWGPEMARVTGVVWGWPSNHGCLVATRAEYLRSFLLGNT